MPFTISHPAIVLPLRFAPNYFSLTGLVVGSMAPDFEYFIRMRTQSVYSHTAGGIFYFDLPISVIVAFLFHNIARNTLIENLPDVFRSRFIAGKSFDWNTYFKAKWAVVLSSIVIGAFSHLFWDGFTHATGFFVTCFPELFLTFTVGGIKLPYYNILQHLSTVVGAIVILITILNMRRLETTPKNIWRYWSLVGICVGIVVLLRLLGGITVMQFGHLFVSAISGVAIAMILIPVLNAIFYRKG